MAQTSSFFSEIQRRLDAVKIKELRLNILYGSLITLALTMGLLLLIIILEEFLNFNTLGRTTLFVIGAMGSLGIVGWFVLRPALFLLGVLKVDDYYTIAKRVGNHFPTIRDRLLDALQIYERREQLQQHYSPTLIDASFIDLYEQVQSLNFLDTVSNDPLRKMRKVVLYAFMIAILVFGISPSGFFNSLSRIVNYNQSFASPIPIQFTVDPGNIEVLRGEDVPITIKVKGEPIKNLSLYTRQQGQVDFDDQLLTVKSGGIFQTEISNIKATTEYYISAKDIKSKKFIISVLDRPLIRSLQLQVTSPSYTRIPPRTLDKNFGEVSAYPGSRIDLQLISSKQLSSSVMALSDSTVIQLSVKGADASGSLTVKKNLSYRLLLTDIDGLQNLDPVEYSIKVIPDEYPTVEILSPGKNIDLTEEMKLKLFIRIKDDFGFSRLRLAYRLAQSRFESPAQEFSFVDIPLRKKNQTPMDVLYQWDVSSIHLVPEDMVAYYVEVFDNDNISGPKSGRSEMYLLRLPSLEEVFSDVSQSHQQSIESMQSIAKETQQLKQDIEELQREIRKSRQKIDWQHQKKAEEMIQRYDAIKNKLDETSQKMDEMERRMEEHKLLSNETLEKYLEIQKLIEKLNAPELQEALKKLRESLKRLSPKQIKQAMEQLKFSEEQFRRNLERTIELLKRIHIEQKIDELIKRAKEMVKQQELLKQRTAEINPSDQQKREELARRQQDLQHRMKSLEKEASDLKRKMEEFPKEMPLEEMEKAERQLKQSQTGQKMEKSVQQIRAGNMKAAQQNQQQSKEEISEFMRKMQEVQKALREKQMRQIVDQMRKQVQNVLELSKREESLKEETRNLDPNSQRFREEAQEQNALLNDLMNVANALGELGKKTFAISPEMGREIGNAMKEMGEALRKMEERNPGSSSQQQIKAMGSLNKAAMMMQNALGGMMQGSKPGMGMAGLMGRLQQMAGMQGKINSQTQQAMSMGKGQAFSAEQQAEYQRLAKIQEAVQKSLEQLAQEAKNTGEFSKLLGDLDRIAEEMQEVQTDLSQGDVNPATVSKQERILSRLLDSQRSLRERDYEKRRRAEVGKNIRLTSPAELNLSTQEGKNKLREEMLKALEKNYSKDYEELIKKYFEQLEKEKVKP